MISDSFIQRRHQSFCHDVGLGQNQWLAWAGYEMTYVGQTQGVWEEEKTLKMAGYNNGCDVIYK